MRIFIKEPLLHFFVLGIAIFFCYSLVSSGAIDDSHEISVDQDNLLSYLQFRSRAFDHDQFETMLASMDDEEREKLVQEYVKEEALYREAKAMQLDKNDYVSRMRLIQQLEYIVKGFVEQKSDLTKTEVEAYYSGHQGDYYINPKITFTHVFITSEGRGQEKARRLAQEMAERMNKEAVSFTEAPSLGGRFLYHVNYVDKEKGEISSHFGGIMAEQLFSLKPDSQKWQGPLQSPFGFHVVMVTKHAEGGQPLLEKIYEQVARDAMQAKMREKFDAAIQAIVQTYRINRQAALSVSGEKS